MVSLGILRFPLTSMDSMAWPAWAAVRAGKARQKSRRPMIAAARTLKVCFGLTSLKDRNMPTSEHVSGNHDYTEANADAPLTRTQAAISLLQMSYVGQRWLHSSTSNRSSFPNPEESRGLSVCRGKDVSCRAQGTTNQPLSCVPLPAPNAPWSTDAAGRELPCLQ